MMEANMKVSIKMDKNMDRESIYGMTVLSIVGIGRIIK